MKYIRLKGSPVKLKTDSLALGRFENEPLKFKWLEKQLENLPFNGRLGQSVRLTPPPSWAPACIVVVGLGKKTNDHFDANRQAAAQAVRAAGAFGAKKINLFVPLSTKSEIGIQAAVEGCELGAHRFAKYRSHPKSWKNSVQSVGLFYDGSSTSFQKQVRLGKIYAESTCIARDLVSEPAGFLTPGRMVQIARTKIRGTGLKLKIIDVARARKMGMGGLVGVGQGSAYPPYLIHITYKARKKSAPHIGLLGKGVTFDSGGYSIKPAKGMETMKCDMAGSAAVFGAMLAIAKLKPECHVEGVMCMVENMVDAKAYRPGDVLKAMNGKTIEVLNTDAEGRIVLADGLCYLESLKVDGIVDLATLTGACVVALGDLCAGVMTRHPALSKALIEASKPAGEMLTELPLIEEYRQSLQSNLADVKNIGFGYGGAITAGLFLSEFVSESTPWAHMDIAGPAWADKQRPLYYPGGTGYGVRTLLHFVSQKNLAKTLKSK